MTRVVAALALSSADTGGQTGTVNEPSVASSGNRIMVAGNWFASRSTDGGASWDFVSPFSEFPAEAGGFCCDQVITYIKSHRLWVWLLQYHARDGSNIFRLAVSKTGANDTWTWWDTSASDIDPSWHGLWFDYPDMVAGPTNLWVTFNLYRTDDDSWERAVVMRFDLDELDARNEISRTAWSTQRTGGLRLARGADSTMWFAGHSDDNGSVHLFSWAHDQAQVDEFNVQVEPWNERDYHSVLPDGAQWLTRADGRITGCWIGDGVLGLAWNAGADATHPHPFIRAVRIDLNTLEIVDQPDLWSSDRAWAYPAVGLNQRGEPGLSAFCGGSVAITHAVGKLESKGTWDMVTAAVSTHGPATHAWGDYVEVHPDPSRKTYWMASGFTLQHNSSRFGVVPQVITFAP